ncbi:putative mitotic check point protein BUB2 isoform X1 [Schistocerca gregaria]|uniref:putative mitotic check point protein BUB2 isoform X1 n=1 Tax=Schistocerca gregaria TaxID=7010 RepID=UPI00211E8ACA|nr:putative mitotic check point protein BUB2 isoform X1 [Schistocerca gregaria]
MFSYSPYSEIKELSQSELRKQYDDLLEYGASHPEELEQNLAKLRDLITCYGLPSESEDDEYNVDEQATLRGKIWQLFLGLKQIYAEEYLSLVKLGPSSAHSIISLDATRTFPKEKTFRKRVTLEKLIRVLNAFQHKVEDRESLGYIQGLNCLVAPFLYNMPEIEAFYTFYHFIVDRCPRYCGNQMGALDGDSLVQQILKLVDPKLFSYLEKNSVQLCVFSHPALQSILTNTPPLEEVLKLWDWLFMYGVHMAVIFLVCILLVRREEILVAENPNSRYFQYHNKFSLDAELITNLAIQVVAQIPSDLYKLCAIHPLVPLNGNREGHDFTQSKGLKLVVKGTPD